jgi:4-hydroxy-4-methyl-2-oxoglutarate aldolase
VDRFGSDDYDQLAKTLYTPVVADTMDKLGYRQQVMRHDIRPLYPEARIVGRAATMLCAETYQIPEEPYKLELALLDDLKPGEVVTCTCLGSRSSAIWGELLATCARARGGRGAVIDGMIRDSQRLIGMNFPVFSVGLTPADSLGRCEAFAIRVPIKVGDVLVHNGDLIVCDSDGCLVIPQEIEAETIKGALEKVTGENRVRELLSRGASIRQVFMEYGIL